MYCWLADTNVFKLQKLLYFFQQDAHEMFHVLTQTITEETMSYPGVVPLFEVRLKTETLLCNVIKLDGQGHLKTIQTLWKIEL